MVRAREASSCFHRSRASPGIAFQAGAKKLIPCGLSTRDHAKGKRFTAAYPRHTQPFEAHTPDQVDAPAEVVVLQVFLIRVDGQCADQKHTPEARAWRSSLARLVSAQLPINGSLDSEHSDAASCAPAATEEAFAITEKERTSQLSTPPLVAHTLHIAGAMHNTHICCIRETTTFK